MKSLILDSIPQREKKVQNFSQKLSNADKVKILKENKDVGIIEKFNPPPPIPLIHLSKEK